MQRETPPDFEAPASDHEAHDWANVIGLMPELPSLGQRWTIRETADVSMPSIPCERGVPIRWEHP
jgi:hypothetical protein